MPSPIAHVTIGYCLYRLLCRVGWTYPQSRPQWASIFLLMTFIFFSLLPDSDSVLGILSRQFGRFHNQFSHSLFFWMLPSLLVAGMVNFMGHNRRIAFLCGTLCLASCVIHILMDSVCHGRGVMLFWPLTSQRFSTAILLFNGVRWSDGLWSLRHIPTLINEFLFAAVILPPILYLTPSRPVSHSVLTTP